MPPALGSADRGQEAPLGAVLVANRGLGTGNRLGEGDQLAAIRGAKGAAGEREVESLQEVRLARAVLAEHRGDAVLEGDLDAREAPQRSGDHGW